MPGLSVAYDAAVGRSDERDDRRDHRDDRVAAALGATEHFDHYDATTALTTDDVAVGRTSYDGYPIRRVETDHGTVFLEGYLYDVEADAATPNGGGDDAGDGAVAEAGSNGSEAGGSNSAGVGGDRSDAAASSDLAGERSDPATERSEAARDERSGVADDLATHLDRVAALIAADDVAGLREWVGARDGDFLIAVVDGDTVALCNDAFARLPTYLATIGGTVVCSRELAFVRAFARERSDPLELDRLGIAQHLAFGYLLGTRTTFAGVQSIPPGSLVRLRPGSETDEGPDAGDEQFVAIDSLYELDFDDCAHADRSVEANAEELASRIERACRRRVAPERPTVVSLSGGLDSRVVAGAYATIGAGETAGAGEPSPADDSAPGSRPASLATFRRRGARTDDEVAAAGAVADVLDLDWTVYAIEGSPERRRALLDAKQGMNFLGMAYVLDFFEQLRERHGTTTCVTGDGGDKTLVGLEPGRQPASEADLVDHVIAANGRLPLETAAAIANVDPNAIRTTVADRLRSYPESDRSRRYVHFLVRERGINFLGQGEDRNRYYAWSVSPFYALPVFEYAMNCPDDQKAYRDLLARILDRFDPALSGLPYPNYGAPITSRRYRAKQFVYDALERYPGVRDSIVDLVTADGASAEGSSEIAGAIRDDLDGLERTGLSRASTETVLASSDTYTDIQLELVATVAALASDVAGERDRPDAIADATGRALDVTTSDDGGESSSVSTIERRHARVDR